jgi:hypothetical protein
MELVDDTGTADSFAVEAVAGVWEPDSVIGIVELLCYLPQLANQIAAFAPHIEVLAETVAAAAAGSEVLAEQSVVSLELTGPGSVDLPMTEPDCSAMAADSARQAVHPVFDKSLAPADVPVRIRL